MAKLYFRKIKNKEINPAAGNLWCINDVPDRWRAAVQELLNAENGAGV